MDTKQVGVVDVKVKDAGEGADGFGTFEAVLSAASVDRDGEVVDAHAFEPLPESIVIHTDHVFSVANAVARAVPSYENGTLVVRGRFSSDPVAQSVRKKVQEGIITTMSAGFMGADRDVKDGVPHITKGELLEGSFVTVPSNRDALVLSAKVAKVTGDVDLLQKLHDLAVSQGAACEHKHHASPESAPTEPAKAAAPATAKSPADVAALLRARAALAAGETALL